MITMYTAYIRIRKGIFIILISMLMSHFSFAQVTQFKFKQLDSLQKIEERPVVVFLHTSWCKYCGIMKNTTLKSNEVAKILNEKFYFVSLDIEEKQDVNFNGYTFRYKPTGSNTGVHELAEHLGTINGQLAYPGICILDGEYAIIYQKEGYITTKALLAILKRLN